MQKHHTPLYQFIVFYGRINFMKSHLRVSLSGWRNPYEENTYDFRGIAEAGLHILP